MIYLERKLSRFRNLINLQSNTECFTCQKQITDHNENEFMFQEDNHRSFIKDFYKTFFSQHYKVYLVYLDELELNQVAYCSGKQNYLYYQNVFLLCNILSKESDLFIKYAKEHSQSIQQHHTSKIYPFDVHLKNTMYILNPYYRDNLTKDEIIINSLNDIFERKNINNGNNIVLADIDNTIIKSLQKNTNSIQIKLENIDLCNLHTITQQNLLPPESLVYNLFLEYCQHNKTSIECSSCSSKKELKKAKKISKIALDNL